MTSITPVHRHSIPAMEMASSTAAPAPSTAAAATSGPLPTASPHRMDSATIPVQITLIVKMDSPFQSISMGRAEGS